MSNKKIVVLGANGYLGSYLCIALLKSGFKVHAVLRNAEESLPLQKIGCYTHVFSIDDQEFNFLQETDIVINTIAKLGSGIWEEFYKTNVWFLEKLINECVVHKVKKLIHISSIEVYGDFNNTDLYEETPLKLCGQYYSDSKILAERKIEEGTINRCLDYIIIRPGMIYGPGSEFWIERICNLMLGQGMEIVGDGTGRVYLTYIYNLVDAICYLCSNNVKVKKLNLVDFEDLSWNEWLKDFEKYFNISCKIKYISMYYERWKQLVNESVLKKKHSKRIVVFTRESKMDCSNYEKIKNYLVQYRDYVASMKETAKWLEGRM